MKTMNVKIMPKLILIFLILILIAGCASPVNLTGKTKKFSITAKQWSFEPGTIRVNLGDIVEIRLKSIDVTHSFILSAFGVNEKLEPGKEIKIEFVADKTGEFSFFCNVPCGRGHNNMNGKIIVA